MYLEEVFDIFHCFVSKVSVNVPSIRLAVLGVASATLHGTPIFARTLQKKQGKKESYCICAALTAYPKVSIVTALINIRGFTLVNTAKHFNFYKRFIKM